MYKPVYCVVMSTNLSIGSISFRALLCLTSFSVTEFLEFGTKLIMSYNKTYEDKHTLYAYNIDMRYMYACPIKILFVK